VYRGKSRQGVQTCQNDTGGILPLANKTGAARSLSPLAAPWQIDLGLCPRELEPPDRRRPLDHGVRGDHRTDGPDVLCGLLVAVVHLNGNVHEWDGAHAIVEQTAEYVTKALLCVHGALPANASRLW